MIFAAGSQLSFNLELALVILWSASFHLVAAAEESIDFQSCVIPDEHVSTFPWQAGLRISLPDEKDAFWPVVIISPYTLITYARTFRAPNRKLRIVPSSNYYISLSARPEVPNVQVHQQQTTFEISYIRPHPQIGRLIQYWMTAENDIVLIHLKTPIEFNQDVRPLCLPTWNHSDWQQWESNNESVIQPGTTNLITGWRCKYYFALQLGQSAFDLEILQFEQCRQIWANQAEYSSYENIGYRNRLCGGLSVSNYTQERYSYALKHTAEPELDPDPGFCSEKCYYILQQTKQLSTGQSKWTLIGTFNGIAQEVFAGPTGYVSLLTPSMIEWINSNIRCGSLNYACGSGECLPLPVRCNESRECADGSDEDPIYCRSMNYCPGNTFECGVYGPCIPYADENGKPAINCDGIVDCPNGEDEHSSICPVAEPSWLQQNWAFVVFPIVALVLCVIIGVGIGVRRSIINAKLYLSDAEIEEFIHGCGSDSSDTGDLFGHGHIEDLVNPTATAAPGNSPGGNVQLNSMQMPFIYNIDKDKFQFGPEIGAGAFGTVYQGYVEGKIVAIKVLRKELVDKELFKAFLAEVKIMSYVNFIKGGHPNIAKLIGAYTDEIRNLNMYIALEFCQAGSIADYLKDNRGNFQPCVTQSQTNSSSTGPHSTVNHSSLLSPQLAGERYIKASVLQRIFSISTLHKWALEVVDGMCFLSSHNIVHSDIAARNILLSCDLTAKISDFGLSKQIYYYNLSGVHIDKNTDLPWRWMAPEVITNMRMSCKSDVWSFAVLLWEIYSLGAVPFGGLGWTPNFVEQLKCGLRLTQPQYASEDMFSLMQESWIYCPDDRPDFETLKIKLNDIVSQARPGILLERESFNDY